MWSFSEVVDGMAEACRAFATPVVSGNVSFYNETEGRGILPTPVIGMVGLVEDVKRVVQPGFKQQGDLIALLGITNDDLAMSEYAVTIDGTTTEEILARGVVPELNLERELAVQQACLEAAEAGLLHSAHDCSDGGLAVALAESSFSSLGRAAIGADVELSGSLSAASLLFSESPSRIILSFDQTAQTEIEKIAERTGAPFNIIGQVGGTQLRIKTNGKDAVSADLSDLEANWIRALSRKLQAEAIAAGME
jgi:phosphoribosylformylglycinamidine synthase